MNKNDSLVENISWAAGHLFGGKYYDKFKSKALTPYELNELCQSYRKHRHYMSDTRKWFQFKLKRADRRILIELGDLLNKIYRVIMLGHPFDLSPYGGPDNAIKKP